MGAITTVTDLIGRSVRIYKKEGIYSLLSKSYNYLSKKFPVSRYLSSSILNTSFDKVTREELLNQQEVYTYSEGDTFEVKPPDYHIDPLPDRLSKHTRRYYFDPPFVSVVENVDLVSTLGVPLTEDSEVILEEFMARKHKLEEYVHRSSCLSELLKFKYFRESEPEQRIEEACSFLNIQSAGYCDWVQCGLSRFEGLEKYTEETGKRPKILLRPDPPEWIIQYLDLLGYQDEDLIEWDSNHLHVERFIVPTVSTPQFDESSLVSHLGRFDEHLRVMNPNSAQWIRRTLVDAAEAEKEPGLAETEFADKVYISRQKAKYRSVGNFDELKKYLTDQGFTICYFEDLSVREQILTIDHAETVIAPHGAGLTNILYSSDQLVIELFGERKRKATFYLLSKIVGHKYGFLLCEQPDDLLINIEKLEELEGSVGTVNEGGV